MTPVEEAPANALRYWLERKPFDLPTVAEICGVPRWKIYRVFDGQSPLERTGAYALAGLFEVAVDELFCYRPYVEGRQQKMGWFARPLPATRDVA